MPRKEEQNGVGVLSFKILITFMTLAQSTAGRCRSARLPSATGEAATSVVKKGKSPMTVEPLICMTSSNVPWKSLPDF